MGRYERQIECWHFNLFPNLTVLLLSTFGYVPLFPTLLLFFLGEGVYMHVTINVIPLWYRQ